ncbi:RodZ family helix-turn-helix domain-containing protein [Dactylosporangium darangshiense]|uniref:hypothetical protein n=1 Tax=Dactylosporangium darangshiense TaxID=579108 RepID=UPI0036298EED
MASSLNTGAVSNPTNAAMANVNTPPRPSRHIAPTDNGVNVISPPAGCVNAARMNAAIVPSSAHSTTATTHVFNATLSTPATAITAQPTTAHHTHDPPTSPDNVDPNKPRIAIPIAL